MIKKNIIITGGSGYIGSALAVASTKIIMLLQLIKKQKIILLKTKK